MKTGSWGVKPFGHPLGSFRQKVLKYSVNALRLCGFVSSASSSSFGLIRANSAFSRKYSTIQRRYKSDSQKCSREDSNLHGFPHTVLSRTRLPFRHVSERLLRCARHAPAQEQSGGARPGWIERSVARCQNHGGGARDPPTSAVSCARVLRVGSPGALCPMSAGDRRNSRPRFRNLPEAFRWPLPRS